MVAFLHNNVGDAWLVLLLQADTGLTDGQQLIIQHLEEEEEEKTCLQKTALEEKPVNYILHNTVQFTPRL